MKKTFILSLTLLLAFGTGTRAQEITARNFVPLSADQKASAKSVHLTGQLTTGGGGDFRQLRDLAWQMTDLDLSETQNTQIPDNALHSRHLLRSLRLPHAVQSIGNQAFFACDALSGTLSFPSTLTIIDESSFGSCRSLAGLAFAPGTKEVSFRSYAFSNCTSLTTISGFPTTKELPEGLFSGCRSLRLFPLPATMETIGSEAFFGCTSLAGPLRLPDSLTYVGASAFEGCTGITSVILPSKCTLGASAFRGCRMLSGSIILATPAIAVLEGTFAGCSRLTSVTLPVSMQQIGAVAFAGCKALRTLTIRANKPPYVDSTSFLGVNVKKVRLCVPKGAVEAYRKAKVWKNFSIVALDIQDKPYYILGDDFFYEPDVVPLPKTFRWQRGSFVWLTLGRIVAPDSMKNEVAHLKRILHERAGLDTNHLTGRSVVTLGIDPSLDDEEAYTLNVTSDAVTIKGKTRTGVFWGLMTLEQMMTKHHDAVTCSMTQGIQITDTPRTRLRELMIDPARTFIPFDDLMAYIPEMARLKLNGLHLHLVDDQGWRIEIKAFPELTRQGSSRIGMDDMQMPVDGFYTQEQMRRLVAYAATYHITVIPEIEMPGHEVAAVHCYPQLTCTTNTTPVPIRTTSGVSNELLCPGNPFTLQFLGQVMHELSTVFTGPYIHLGGDEAGNPALGCWTGCTRCRALKAKLGIADTTRASNYLLQKYLFDAIIDTLQQKYHKTPMFWYETDFKEIQSGCVTYAWRMGLSQAAIKKAIEQKARIILCPGEHCYFDYPEHGGDMPEKNWGMPVTSLKQAYQLDPSWGNGPDFERNNLYGVAGTMWGECLNSPERLLYQTYPRSFALAEAGWTPQASRSYPKFMQRLKPLLRDMQHRGVCFNIPDKRDVAK